MCLNILDYKLPMSSSWALSHAQVYLHRKPWNADKAIVSSTARFPKLGFT